MQLDDLLDQCGASSQPHIRDLAERIRADAVRLIDMLAVETARAKAEQKVADLRAQLAEAEAELRQLAEPDTPGPQPQPEPRPDEPAAAAPQQPDDGADLDSTIRAWAKQAKFPCSARGRVSRRVRQAYEAANGRKPVGQVSE